MIYYLGCYKTGKIEDLLPSGSINAGSFKMSYLIRTVKELGQEITVLSTYDSRKPGLRPYRKARVDDLETDLFFPAFSLPGAGARLGRMVKSLMDLVCLLLFVKPGATLMVYHHPAFARFLPLVKHLKRVRVILEVEEMYHVLEGSRKTFAKERKLLDLADSYLVSNDLIYPEYLRTDRDCAVVYGNYTIPEHPPWEGMTGSIFCTPAPLTGCGGRFWRLKLSDSCRRAIACTCPAPGSPRMWRNWRG